MAAKKRAKTKTFYVPVDISPLEKIIEEIKTDPKMQAVNPVMELGLRIGFKVGIHASTLSPLDKILKKERVSKKTADLFKKLIGIEFRQVRIQIKGRPAKKCAYEDILKNGLKVGIVPSCSYLLFQHCNIGYVPPVVKSLLKDLHIPDYDTVALSNRHSARHLMEGIHFVLGASVTPDNSHEIEIVREFKTEELALLVWDSTPKNHPYRIGVIAGSTEEALLRKLDINQKQVFSMGFDDALKEYLKLFSLVELGEYSAALAPRFILHLWATLTHVPTDVLVNIMHKSADENGTFKDHLKKAENNNQLKPLVTKQGIPLRIVKASNLKNWLKEYAALNSVILAKDLISNQGIALAPQFGPYNVEKLKKVLQSID